MRERAAISYFFQLHLNLCLHERRKKQLHPKAILEINV